MSVYKKTTQSQTEIKKILRPSEMTIPFDLGLLGWELIPWKHQILIYMNDQEIRGFPIQRGTKLRPLLRVRIQKIEEGSVRYHKEKHFLVFSNGECIAVYILRKGRLIW